MIKVKHILLIVLFALIIVIGIFVFKKKNIKVDEQQTIVEESETYYSKEGEGWLELGYKVAEKNGDWSNYPLTEHFRSKYNEKDGILGDIQFDKIEYRPFAGTDKDYYFKEYYTYFVITQGNKKTAYIFDPKYEDDGLRLDDVGIFDKIVISDEDGSDVKVKGNIMDKDTFTYNFYMLSRGGDDEKAVAVSEKFHKKYPYFACLFPHYSPYAVDDIKFIENRSNFNAGYAIFDVNDRLECKKREYKVFFVLDDKGNLDDAKSELISEQSYERKKLTKARDVVFYKNSDWNNLKLTDNFKTKYVPEKGVFQDIDEIDIDATNELQNNDNNSFVFYNKNLIQEFVYKNGKNRWFYCEYIYIEDDYLDDAHFYPIDYNGTNAEEALKKYKEQYNISD